MADALLFPSPAWIVCHKERGPSNLPRTVLPDGMVVVALFTDEHLASRYWEASGAKPGYSPRAIEDRDLAALLAFLEQEDGVTVVAIDPDQNRSSPYYLPIGEFRRQLENHITGPHLKRLVE